MSNNIVFNTREEQARNLEEEKGPVGLYVLDVRSGEQSEIELPSGLEILRIVDWSPDGKWIGIVSESGAYELWVVENVLSDRGGNR